MYNNITIKENLFGKVEKIKATGDNTVNKNLLQQPFENKNSVVYSHCVGCGTLEEMNALDARRLSNECGMEKIEVPESFAGQYFETGGCDVCDSKEKSVTLEDIG